MNERDNPYSPPALAEATHEPATPKRSARGGIIKVAAGIVIGIAAAKLVQWFVGWLIALAD